MRNILFAMCLVTAAQAAPGKPSLRDPFVNPAVSSVQPVVVTGQRATPAPQAVPPLNTPVQDPTTFRLDVETVGLVLSPNGNSAILKSPTQLHIVSEGQKVGDYEILKIGPRKIVWRTHGVRGETAVGKPTR